MKTLSDHPMLIAHLLEADRARRERRARWHEFWRSPMTTLLLFMALVMALIGLCWEVSR